jgi:anthranilate phosphoribosyltransferase
MITDIIHTLVERINLTDIEARHAMEELMAGRATDAQVAGFLTALRMKGETATELAAFARVMREHAEPIWDGDVLPVLDTCGTGGDRSGTFNISTAAAFVVAGTGIRVAKHGNRSASSKCGSADVMEALHIDIQMPTDRLRQAITDIGIGFIFAQRYHSSMKHVMPARNQLGMRTVFNIIGPLSNPALPRYQVIGVASMMVLDLVTRTLLELGTTEHSFVLHGRDGIDEISISAPTEIRELKGSDVKSYSICPEDFGFFSESTSKIQGGDAATNAAIIERICQGERGPTRDVVILNAAPAIVAGGAADTLKEGIRMAEHSVDSGAALKKLQDLRELSK